MKNSFINANEAYEYYLDKLIQYGVDFADTKTLFNVGFYINNPLDNHITNKERKWNPEYAEAEWQWYLSGKPFTSELGKIYGKIPPIWKKMESKWLYRDDFVNSNYGYQWNRNNQIQKVVEQLKSNTETRRAVISIYDGKEIDIYNMDTPCTMSIVFHIIDNVLQMSVYMRSNDIWYGFCNDQYCFSKLQQKVAEMLSIDVGSYYHHATNLHIYNNKL